MIRNLFERIYLLNRNVKSFIFLIIDIIISQSSFYITFFLLYEKLVFTNYDYLYYQLIVTSSFIIFYYYSSFYYQIFRFFNIFKLQDEKVNKTWNTHSNWRIHNSHRILSIL